MPFFASNYGRAGSESAPRTWIPGALALPAAGLYNSRITLETISLSVFTFLSLFKSMQANKYLLYLLCVTISYRAHQLVDNALLLEKGRGALYFA